MKPYLVTFECKKLKFKKRVTVDAFDYADCSAIAMDLLSVLNEGTNAKLVITNIKLK